MRILKVQFTNLNSLAGSWSIDFDSPAYKSDGLFLITGPTGSGKTTLLDAICLGLYGRTPRTTPSANVNEIMTRHENACNAEVTFETAEGRFRASFSQERTNRTGKLKPIRHELADIKGKILSEKATDTKLLIQKYIGLDYEQFVRTVLLAQNGFDSFLRADEQKKSSILEKLTDTSIYTQLSILAHNKKISAEQLVNNLEIQLTGFTLLDKDDYAQKNLHLKELEEKITANEKILDERKKLLNDYKNLNSLKMAAASIQDKLNEHNQQMAALQPATVKLEWHEKLQNIQPAYQEVCSLKSLIEKNENNIKKLGALLNNCENDAKASEAKSIAAKKEFEKIREENLTLRPLLKKASELESLINDKVKIKSEMDRNLQLNLKQIQDTQDRIKSRQQEYETISQKQTENDAWLAAHAADDWLLENMTALQNDCALLQKLANNLQRQIHEYSEQLDMNDKLEKNIRQSELDQQEKQNQLTVCQKNLAELGQKLDELLGGWTIEGLNEAYEEKRTLSIKYRSLEEQRKELINGEPCPLCGSKTHPWKIEDDPEPKKIDARLEELKNKIVNINQIKARIEKESQLQTEITGKLNVIKERQEQFANQLNTFKTSLENQKKSITSIEEELKQLQIKLRRELSPYNLDLSVPVPKIAAMMQKRLAEYKAALTNRGTITQTMTDLTHSLDILREKLKNEEDALYKSQINMDKLKTEMLALKTERQQILPGATVEQEEKRLEESIKNASLRLEKAEKDLNGNLEAYQRLKGELSTHQQNLAENAPLFKIKNQEFNILLADFGINEADFLQKLLPADEYANLKNKIQKLAEEILKLDALQKDKQEELQKASLPELEGMDLARLQSSIEDQKFRLQAIRNEKIQLEHDLLRHEENLKKSRAIVFELTKRKKELQKWERLDRLIGSADGKKFRSYAQSLTLDRLLAFANRQLASINPRYTLKRAPKIIKNNTEINLNLEVVDHYQADEIRSIDNLSGGEVFMASLALALGLSDMAGSSAYLGSLFMDEGFGSLDSETLDMAFTAIGKLKEKGKLIGIISHVETLKDWVPTQLQILQNPNNLSRSIIKGPGCSRSPLY